MKTVFALACAILLSACGALSRLAELGRPPAMTPSADPTSDPDYRPIHLPMPHAQIEPAQASALWRAGSRAFFKDQRAAQVGDIVTVVVSMTDSADVQNASTGTRGGTETMGTPNLLGLEKSIPHVFSGSSPTSLVSTTSTGTSTGSGTIKRNETVTLRLAGVVTQVLANGNLAVAAHQEIRVNNELRQLQVSGVIRPQDIASDNTVLHDRMAEARISYGGRGQISDEQQPRYGQQILDIILPF